MDFDFRSYFILGLWLIIPAAIVLIILMLIRLRRGKFYRHRIKRSKKKKTVE
jgi:hypothetical protein